MRRGFFIEQLRRFWSTANLMNDISYGDITEKMREKQLVRPAHSYQFAPYIAESIGTFGLVFAGCGAIMINGLSGGQVSHLGVGLVFGLIVTVMIYAFGHISGAHFNPAVTLAFVLARHFPIKQLRGRNLPTLVSRGWFYSYRDRSHTALWTARNSRKWCKHFHRSTLSS